MIIKKVKVNDYKNLNIDWNLTNSGNIIAVLGKNASGKTNLLEALMGFSNVADNSKSIKPNFAGEMELDIDGKTVWINSKGIYQKASVESINRKSGKKTVEEFNIPDMLRISVGDDFAPRYFSAQRKYRKFDEQEIRFSEFNEINYGDDFVPFLLYLFAFDENTTPRQILKQEFGIEKLSPVTFISSLKEEEFKNLQQPIKGYLDNLQIFSKGSKKTDSSIISYTEEELRSLMIEFGYESDYFEVMHSLFGNYYKSRSIITTEKLGIIKNGLEIDITNLSDGEKQLIYILAIMQYCIGKNTILLLDEPDIHIYPSLQQKFIKYIKEINDTANVIITTHSPYIVSSLPKEDVFYLYDGEIYPVLHTKGKDLNSIMIEIFNTPIRDHEIADRINYIYQRLHENNLSSDEKENILQNIKDLENDLGDDDYDVITMKTILESK